MVDIKLEKKFKSALPLPALRQVKKLIGMELLRKGSRLSVQPVRPAEWDVIMTLATKSGGK